MALGHLHQPQAVARESTRYSGSLFTYDVSEEDHTKSVTIIDIKGDGVSVEGVTLEPRRRVRRLSGLMDDLLRGPEGLPLSPGAAPGALPVGREDYIWVDLLDPGPVYDAIGRLREVYPNIIHLNRPLFEGGGARRTAPDHRRVSDVDYFRAFFRDTVGEELAAEEEAAFAAVVGELRRQEREV